MIHTKNDLRVYLAADFARNGRKPSRGGGGGKMLIKRLLGNRQENDNVVKYLRTLRLYEYNLNNSKKGLVYFLRSKYYSMRLDRLKIKLGIHIGPNVCGKGLFIPHYAGGIYCNCISMGDYCTVSSGVVIGNKGCRENRAVIGNNVELCIGCKVIGKVTIGDNAIVAPNSVVVKDIPAGAVVSGVPAKVIKFNS